MRNRKESFFWTSYSDLMTSLFFIMLVLFVLVIVLLHKRMEATEMQLEEIKKIEASTKELSDNNGMFIYRPEYKKYVLKIEGRYPKGESDINLIIADDKDDLLRKLLAAGNQIQDFLKRHNETKYVLIIEGQASRDSYTYNYELSYERALGLLKFWTDQNNVIFGDNCEILISGSGDGKLDTHSMREKNESDNQRFLIHILPKNIFENNED